MAYHFSAAGQGVHDLQTLHKRLSQFELVEFFPVDQNDDPLTLGLSIPFKAMDDPRFGTELEQLMTYLIVEQAFEVTDLFTGNSVKAGDIAGLARRISA